MVIPESGKNPGCGKLDGAFSIRLIIRRFYPGWYNGRTIIFSHFRISPGNDCFVAGIPRHTGPKVIRDQETGHPAKIGISMDMAVDEILFFHITTRFSIDEAAAGKGSNKEIDRSCISCNPVINIKGPPGPIHFKCVPWLTLDTHGRFTDPCPFMIQIRKLGAHIRCFSGSYGLGTVFRPKK